MLSEYFSNQFSLLFMDLFSGVIGEGCIIFSLDVDVDYNCVIVVDLGIS